MPQEWRDHGWHDFSRSSSHDNFIDRSASGTRRDSWDAPRDMIMGDSRAAASEPFPPLPPAALLPVPPPADSSARHLLPHNLSSSHVNDHVLGIAAAAAAADAFANHIAREADSAAPLQVTTICRICSQAHINHVDGMCSRCHNPLTAKVVALNNARAYDRQREFAERYSTDSVAVRVHDGVQGNRGLHRSRTPAKMERQKDLEIQIRFRRLGFKTGVDLFNETNWSAQGGSTTAPKPQGWRQKMDAQHLHDNQHDRDLAFYQALDSRLASHRVTHMPMSLAERVQRFGGQLSVHPQPGAPPLSRQHNVGRTIEHVAEENRRIRERSRSRDSPWQGSTGWASSSRSSSWRPGEWQNR